MANIIKKNISIATDSKSLSDFDEAIKHTEKRYIIDENYLKINKNSQFIIIDDVIGNGSSMMSVLKKIYDITNKINYFFVVVKGVKRWRACL